MKIKAFKIPLKNIRECERSGGADALISDLGVKIRKSKVYDAPKIDKYN